ncbi:Uncharacterized protein PBTT_07080 [Plasmodiophora brassicae]
MIMKGYVGFVAVLVAMCVGTVVCENFVQRFVRKSPEKLPAALVGGEEKQTQLVARNMILDRVEKYAATNALHKETKEDIQANRDIRAALNMARKVVAYGIVYAESRAGILKEMNVDNIKKKIQDFRTELKALDLLDTFVDACEHDDSVKAGTPVYRLLVRYGEAYHAAKQTLEERLTECDEYNFRAQLKWGLIIGGIVLVAIALFVVSACACQRALRRKRVAREHDLLSGLTPYQV